MTTTLRAHWPEYLMEAAGLGFFMVSAGVCGVILEFPGSPIHALLPDPLVRRALMGVAMGLTAIVLIYYPWGQQSGAHYNPAVTLAFLRLGRIKRLDAACYVAAQFVGGTLGVILVHVLFGARFAQAPVSFVATLPGPHGALTAFTAEAVISGLLMFMVLVTTVSRRWMRYTGVFAGMLLALYITFEAPLSGMSINPARTFASALPARLWTAWWVYFTAPPLGMLAAVELYRMAIKQAHKCCAKLNHHTARRCIFCGFGMHNDRPATQTTSVAARNRESNVASNPAA